MTRPLSYCLLLAALCCAAPAQAEEGMWTFDNFPRAKVKATYGFDADDAWLQRVMRASARLGGGCSGSFVSPRGLVVTNHHCVSACIQALSTKKRDFAALGFVAKTEAQEQRCPDMEVHQLIQITDVTATVTQSTQGLSGQQFHDALKAVEARLEKECQSNEQTRCDVVRLYRGGQFRLHRYKRFSDVRLAFAPERAAAFFGGDPYNFTFPRFDLDVSFIRVRQDGKSATTPDHFRWSRTPVSEGTLTFVSGNPGSTERLLTVAQLLYQRDVALPESLLSLAELRGVLTEFGRRGQEERRISEDVLFGVENRYKGLRGRWQALMAGAIVEQRLATERQLRAAVATRPALQVDPKGAWDAIAKATKRQAELRKPYVYIEGNGGAGTALMRIARTLVRGTAELAVPNEKRLEEYSDASLPTLKQSLFSTAPIYNSLQILMLTHSFTKIREELGPNHPFVTKALGPRSPDELATHLVKGTRLAEVAFRRKLWQGGVGAVQEAAKTDALLAYALMIDGDARAVRKLWETEVDAVILKNSEVIAKARFALQGTQTYPDATFSARLSYGTVKGYEEEGSTIAPVTTFAGAFERHTGREPFALPQTWLAAKAKLDLNTPLNFATTNDIIGGNSGSPVIDREAAVVGLIFDGNLASLGGDYGYDALVNRAVVVSSVGIWHALEKIYGAQRLINELVP